MSDRILFSELINNNLPEIYSNMRWENYNLNDVTIEVTEKVQQDALMVLTRNYGRSKVYSDILDDFLSDVFIYFPILLQQLAITRLIDGTGVVKDDTATTETVRSEELSSQTGQTGTVSNTGNQTDTNTLNTLNTTTGTISVEGENEGSQTSATTIENSAGTEATGNRSVNLSHNLPEQAINGITGNFPTDEQGTPILSNAYTQEASEAFSTMNPITSSETSEQNIENSDFSTTNTVTTNDVSVANTGTTTRVVANTDENTSEVSSETTGNNTITETVTATTTNKQYAYEVKAFLETAQSTIAFKNWVNQFSWIEGII